MNKFIIYWVAVKLLRCSTREKKKLQTKKCDGSLHYVLVDVVVCSISHCLTAIVYVYIYTVHILILLFLYAARVAIPSELLTFLDCVSDIN